MTALMRRRLALAGMAAFAGEWRYPGQELEPRALHNAHDHVHDEAKPCPQKYCIAPTGPLGRLSWDVHSLSGLAIGAAYRLPFKKMLKRSDIGFLHCARVSTNWKRTPHILSKKIERRHDLRTRALLDRAFSREDPNE